MRPLSLYFDPAEFTPDEIADILVLLSDLYRSIGGDGLVIVPFRAPAQSTPVPSNPSRSLDHAGVSRYVPE